MNNKPILDGVTVLAFTQYIFETSPITPLTELLKENGAQIIQVQYASEFMEKEKSEMKQNEERQSEQKLKLNLKKKKVRDFVLQHLISKCDIIVEAFRPGVMEKFGLSPISVHRVNPKVIYVRISGFGHNEEIPEIIDASRDLNYLAKAGLLQKFRRSAYSKEISTPGNILTARGTANVYTFTLILQAIVQQKTKVVIDAALAQALMYTSQPVITDAYLQGPLFTPLPSPSKLRNNMTYPHHCVFKCQEKNEAHPDQEETFFILKPGGILHEKLEKARFGSEDGDQVDQIQRTMQIAFIDMTLEEIGNRWGPVEKVQYLEQPQPIELDEHQDSLKSKFDVDVNIRDLFGLNKQKPVFENSWELIEKMGVPTDMIEKIQKKMIKDLAKKIPLAKL